jgi:SAM-dependent methyltransferase
MRGKLRRRRLNGVFVQRAARLAGGLYELVAGRHPALRPWHHQWLAGSLLYRDFRRAFAEVEGDVVDVGCGDGPYRPWLVRARSYTGIDITPGAAVNHLVTPGEPWPVPAESFDAAICTQVLEHVRDPGQVIDEIVRVTRPGGDVIISVPFIYPEHGAPLDFRRFSRFGITELLDGRLVGTRVHGQGGIGSSMAVLFLGWIEHVTSATLSRLLIRTMLLPLWLSLCLVVNALGVMFDRLDGTGMFYGNVLVFATAPVSA